VTADRPESPAAVVARIAGASLDGFRPDLRVVGAPGPEWMSIAALGTAEAAAERRARVRRSAGPGAPARIGACWDVEGIAWFLGALVAGSMLGGGAVLVASPDSVWARIGPDGLAEGLAVSSDAFAAPARLAAARRILHELLAPVVEVGARAPARVLWWHAGDRVADAVLWCGEAFGRPDDAKRLAYELLAPGVPYSVPLGLEAGRARTRRTCCLSRLTAGGEPCEGCPHQRDRSRRVPRHAGPEWLGAATGSR
jgi:hypothetical protein